MLSRIYSPSRNKEDAFTLIELLIVVIIIGILAAIALPIFLNQQKAAADASVQSDVRNTVENVASWQVSHQNTATANTAAFVTAGGKAVTSGSNTVDVVTNADGSYTVCGYSAKGAQFNSVNAAYLYDSSTGKFTTSTAGCPGDQGSPSASGAIAAPDSSNYKFTFETDDPSNGNWSGGTFSTAQAFGGTRSYATFYPSGTTDTATQSGAAVYAASPTLLPNSTYKVTLNYYMISSDNTVSEYFYAGGTTYGLGMPTAGQWNTVTFNMTTTSSTGAFAQLRFFPKSYAASQTLGADTTVYIDNISFVKQ